MAGVVGLLGGLAAVAGVAVGTEIGLGKAGAGPVGVLTKGDGTDKVEESGDPKLAAFCGPAVVGSRLLRADWGVISRGGTRPKSSSSSASAATLGGLALGARVVRLYACRKLGSCMRTT